MTNKVKPIPEGYHTATPYLIVKDAARHRVLQESVWGCSLAHRLRKPDLGRMPLPKLYPYRSRKNGKGLRVADDHPGFLCPHRAKKVCHGDFAGRT